MSGVKPKALCVSFVRRETSSSLLTATPQFAATALLYSTGIVTMTTPRPARDVPGWQNVSRTSLRMWRQSNPRDGRMMSLWLLVVVALCVHTIVKTFWNNQKVAFTHCFLFCEVVVFFCILCNVTGWSGIRSSFGKLKSVKVSYQYSDNWPMLL